MTRKEFILALSAIPFVGGLSQRKGSIVDINKKIETTGSEIKKNVCTCGQVLDECDRYYFEQSLVYAVACPKCKKMMVIAGSEI